MRRSARFIAFCTRAFAMGLLALVLSACSRTVTWEEEVPLNTGETIWIERSMPWEMRGGFGNPFDIAMRPTREQRIRFNYRSKEFVYEGRANVRWIAVSSSGDPVLVAPAADYGWHSQNRYFCVTPYYVQLNPDPTGKHWTWPERIEPWLYHLPANVMSSLPNLAETTLKRYTAADRDQRDEAYRRKFPAGYRIDPMYKASGCVSRVDVDMADRPDWARK